MKKFSSLILLVFYISGLIASELSVIDSEILINGLLQKNSDYQQLLNKYEQEKATAKIDKSLSLFDVNFSYQSWDNDIERYEIGTSLEESKINEEDERWKIELAKQFFPKDFDATADEINASIDLFRLEQELIIARTEYLSDALEDIVDWFEAEEMTKLLKRKLLILQRENEVLEELNRENIIEIESLIENLEEIEKLEKNIADLQEICSKFELQYELPVTVFSETIFRKIIEKNTLPDTIKFHKKVDFKRNKLIDSLRKIRSKIKISYYKAFLPEVNLSFSYNWRNTDQVWDTTQNGVLENMQRNQKEEFPETGIEFSLPFNIISNTSGKLALLNSHQNELDYRFNEIRTELDKFQIERMYYYNKAKTACERKKRLKELYNKNLEIIQKKFAEEPTLLGKNPELKLEKETLKNEKAELEYKVAEMNLFKEIILINNFVEEAE